MRRRVGSRIECLPSAHRSKHLYPVAPETKSSIWDNRPGHSHSIKTRNGTAYSWRSGAFVSITPCILPFIRATGNAGISARLSGQEKPLVPLVPDRGYTEISTRQIKRKARLPTGEVTSGFGHGTAHPSSVPSTVNCPRTQQAEGSRIAPPIRRYGFAVPATAGSVTDPMRPEFWSTTMMRKVPESGVFSRY